MFKVIDRLKTTFLYLYGTIENCPEELYYIGGSDTLPPPLEKEEEAKVIEKLKNGDLSVKNTLIERNLRLVVYIARKFEIRGFMLRI